MSTPEHPAATPSTAPSPAARPRTFAQRGTWMLENVLFSLRWLMAPLYLGLAFGLVAVLVKFWQEVWHLVRHLTGTPAREVTLQILQLIDLALVGNLVVLVMFVGYENFVSRLDAADGEDRPTWLGHVDYSGLKLKLIGSLVAISAIELLGDFLSDRHGSAEGWRIALHLTFVLSGLLFAITDRISAGTPHEGA